MLKRMVASPVAAVIGFVLGAMIWAAAFGFVTGLGVDAAAAGTQYATIGGVAGGTIASLRVLGVGA